MKDALTWPSAKTAIVWPMMHHRCNTATPWRVEVRFEAYHQKKTQIGDGGGFHLSITK
jgi:hypothetical protein